MLQPATDKGNEAPVTFFGVATSVLLAAGLLCVLSRTSLSRIHADIPAYRPQYVEIYRLGEVKGISMPFMTVDLLGGVFSTLSLVFKSKFDVLAGVAYSLVVVRLKLEIFIALLTSSFFSGLGWCGHFVGFYIKSHCSTTAIQVGRHGRCKNRGRTRRSTLVETEQLPSHQSPMNVRKTIMPGPVGSTVSYLYHGSLPVANIRKTLVFGDESFIPDRKHVTGFCCHNRSR